MVDKSASSLQLVNFIHVATKEEQHAKLKAFQEVLHKMHKSKALVLTSYCTCSELLLEQITELERGITDMEARKEIQVGVLAKPLLQIKSALRQKSGFFEDALSKVGD